MDTVLTAVGTLGGLTAAVGALLALAQRWLRVQEDPRIDAVEQLLPASNCGGCGYPGCRPFAEALVNGEAQPAGCTVSSPQGRARIANYLGVAVGQVQPRVARLACAGGAHVAHMRARYSGIESCAGAAAVGGGGKSCSWGCLGLGDCVDSCDFDALHLDGHGLPHVREDHCTACGACVRACPKDLFSLQPRQLRLWVACRSALVAEESTAHCDVACNACGRCAADAPQWLTMDRGLPVLTPGATPTDDRPIHRCPTGAIVWFDPEGTTVKGPEARPIVRTQPKPDVPT